MKTAEFNRIYNRAKTVRIVDNEWFNFAGFFWINLTDHQHNKMVDLILSQGETPTIIRNGTTWIVLQNGLQLRINKEI